MNDQTWSQTLTGGVFVAAGVLLLGAQADWWSLGALLRWWPIALVAVGVSRGVATRDGFVWIGDGGLLLLWSTGGVAWRESWPLLLVVHGLALVFWPSGRTCVRRDGSRVR